MASGGWYTVCGGQRSLGKWYGPCRLPCTWTSGRRGAGVKGLAGGGRPFDGHGGDQYTQCKI